MIRMRCFARAMILGTLVAASLTVSAAGWALLTVGLDVFLLDAGKVLGGVFVVVMGLFGFAKGYNAIFLEPQFRAMEERQHRMIESGLAAMKEAFASLIEHHVTAHDPHPIASDRLHDPLYEADQKILGIVEDLKKMQTEEARRLGKLIAAHNVAMGAQRAAMDAIACVGHRDPSKSPFPRRDTDPHTSDFTGQRGHPTGNGLIVDDDVEEP